MNLSVLRTVRCPTCVSRDTRIIKTRLYSISHVPVIWRKRRCQACGTIFRTNAEPERVIGRDPSKKGQA
jgi:transcriptional regulator NrdR family protein